MNDILEEKENRGGKIRIELFQVNTALQRKKKKIEKYQLRKIVFTTLTNKTFFSIIEILLNFQITFLLKSYNI